MPWLDDLVLSLEDSILLGQIFGQNRLGLVKGLDETTAVGSVISKCGQKQVHLVHASLDLLDSLTGEVGQDELVMGKPFINTLFGHNYNILGGGTSKSNN
jgi:hypothetical protein